MILSALAAGLLVTFPLPRLPASPPRPRLIVLLVVDQLRPDQLLRYRAEWTGGFKQALERGAVYSHGRQDHAITQTAPGHATLLSGRFPAHTGIVTNDIGVVDTLARVIGDSGEVGASPRRFRGTTLVDWLIAHDSATRILSVSRKDRGAILPVGRAKGEIFWWSNLGFFTTSRYYRDTLPDWIVAWNAKRPVARLAGRTWDLLQPASEYREADTSRYERGKDGRDVFPHRLTDRMPEAGAWLKHFPWMDSLTLDVALDGLHALGLGRRGAGRTDLLSISLSATDEVGHDFGPDSREMHDQLLRLDRWLGQFLDSLAPGVSPSETVFVLTSDHGSLPIPELIPAAQGGGGRVWPTGLSSGLRRRFGARWQTDFGFRFDYGLLVADVAALRARGIAVDSLRAALARDLEARPGVARVYTPPTLASAPAADQVAARWKRTIPADLEWLVAVVPKENMSWSTDSVGANHGTPAELDVLVPIVLWGAGIRAGEHTRPVRTVDIAPTLARLLGIRPTERLDGVPLREVE
jgi:predicted AlkP superfamily pyrophosphatase or phosphodiesterase